MKNRLLPVLLLATASGACASINGGARYVEAPRLRQADDRQAQLSVSSDAAPRAATFRVFAEVRNPNSSRLKLAEVKGSLFLDGEEAADVDLPLDLELKPREEAVVPIDVKVPLDKAPALAQALSRTSERPVAYRVDGTMKVETAQGEPVFGPLTLLEGQARVD